MVCLCLMLLFTYGQGRFAWLDTLCVWVITLTTLYSGAEYFLKNRDILSDM